MNTLREDFHLRPGWTFGRGGNVGTGAGGVSECEPVPHTASGTGGGRSEAIRNIYYSDRQLPPGHDPGADYGEAPHGRQRGSRPCNILVESRGYLMPRRDERPR